MQGFKDPRIKVADICKTCFFGLAGKLLLLGGKAVAGCGRTCGVM
jgi:hypothetical protein